MPTTKAKTKPTSSKPTPQRSLPVSVTLHTGGLKYEAQGKTIPEALGNLDPKVFKIRGRLIVTSGNLKSEMLLRPIQMRRLAVNALTREIIGKRLATLLH